MKALIELELAPFSIPDFVRQATPPGYSADNGEAIPLSACAPETLEKLCDDFRNAVFEKAGKQQPAIAVCSCGARL